MKLLWLMTARGGSRGVPGKNLRQLGGLSLIGWKARAAFAAGADRVVLSTDSAEIAGEGVAHGCVALMRPAELASDTATSASVVRHALETLGAAGESYDAVCLLEPSAPFATAGHYRQAIAMMKERDADLVVAMKRVTPHHTFVGEQRDDGSITGIVLQMRRAGERRRRQDFAEDWTCSGSTYLFRVPMFMETSDLYGGARNFGFLVDKWRGLEIDSLEDLEMAEFAVARGYVAPEDVTREQRRRA